MGSAAESGGQKPFNGGRQRFNRRKTRGESSADALHPHADVATRYLQHRAAILARLERVNRALAYVDEYEANQHLPADLQRPMRAPTIGRRDLAEFHRMLVEELRWLEQGVPDQ